MKNKRLLMAVVCIVVLALVSGGCSVSAELAGNMIAPWEQTLNTPEPEVTPAPEETPLTLPSQEVSTAPTDDATPTPTPVSSGDINRLMFFDATDVAAAEGFWPLTTYKPADFGELSSVFLSYGDDFFYLSYTIESTKDFNELKSTLTSYVSGAWDESDTSATVYSGAAEGIQTDCSIDSYGQVTFTFSMSGNYNEVNDLLDKHWPADAIAMPPEMEGNLKTRCVALSSVMIYLSYEWDFSGYRDAFQWFRDNMWHGWV
jgi:hypothetical protein